MNQAKEKAIEQHDVATYLLKTTYPAIKDPKLLITILHNIHSSINSAMDALIGKELPSFRQKIIYLQEKNYKTIFIQEVYELIELHKKSPMEFSRDGKYVICSENYHLKPISVDSIHDLLNQTKDLLDLIH